VGVGERRRIMTTALALWVAYDDPGLADVAECITTTVDFG
jgi:hypothetical protein